jgi:hypothetical protein
MREVLLNQQAPCDPESGAAAFSRARISVAFLAIPVGLAVALAGCGQTLDVGRDLHPTLPVDVRNPVVITNDGCTDNWVGEYAVLLANSSYRLPLKGIVVNASNYWSDLNANMTDWSNLAAAARSSGLKNVPELTRSDGAPLTAPADGSIDSTKSNGSKGAQLILDLSRELSLPWRPLVVVTAAQLTDVADAYLMDHDVVNRVVVVASLGTYPASKGLMSGPNGDLDPWADWIVAQRFRYVQISVLYDQSGEVTADDLPNLPRNYFGTWMANKQPKLLTLTTAADQLAILTMALPTFPTAVQRSSADTSAGFNSPPGQGPPLVSDPNGNAWLVTEVASSLARSTLWQLLDNFGS